MKFAKKGSEIMSKIKGQVLPLLNGDETLQKSLTQFSDGMDRILSLWFSAMCFMERTGRHDPMEILRFQTEGQELKEEIAKLAEDFEAIALPTTSKWHVFLTPNCGLDRQLSNWEITGRFAEQNTETVHAIMNQLARRFGSLRGHHKKTHLLKTWIVEGSHFVSEGVSNILNTTKLSEATKKKACPQLREEERISQY